MDDNIRVDQSVLSTTYPALNSELNKLMQYAEGLKRNLSIAAVKFDSENFKRASNILSNTQNNLVKAAEQMHKLKAYFDKLQTFIEEYTRAKF